MSTSVLYNLFGIRGGSEYVRTEYAAGGVMFTVRQRRETLRCSHCGSKDVHVKTHENRLLRTLPVGSRPVQVYLPVARVHCQHCGKVRQVEVKFAKPRVS